MTREDALRLADKHGKLTAGWMFDSVDLQRLVEDAALAERAACVDLLMRLHAQTAGAHNHYHFAANALRDRT